MPSVVNVVFLCLIFGNICGLEGHAVEMVKRELRWNDQRDIVSDTGAKLRIDYLQPHPNNVAVDMTKNYLSFNIYQKPGLTLPPNTGIFHFVSDKTALDHARHCPRPTMHAGSYHFFYGKCPEDETNLVASGYCYQAAKGLVYNSNTFNKGYSMSYLNKHFYLETDSRVVNKLEQPLIKHCFDTWKAAGFPVHGWKCVLNKVRLEELESFMPNVTQPISLRRSDCGCECQPAPFDGDAYVKFN